MSGALWGAVVAPTLRKVLEQEEDDCVALKCLP